MTSTHVIIRSESRDRNRLSGETPCHRNTSETHPGCEFPFLEHWSLFRISSSNSSLATAFLWLAAAASPKTLDHGANSCYRRRGGFRINLRGCLRRTRVSHCDLRRADRARHHIRRGRRHLVSVRCRAFRPRSPGRWHTYRTLVDLARDPRSGVSIIELRKFSRSR